MDAKFEVRRATFHDIPMLSVMVYRQCEEAGETLSETKERYIQAYIMHELMAGSLCALVAVVSKRKKERIIGAAMFDIRMHPYGGIQAWGHHLYVDPQYRGGDGLGSGKVAKRLISEAESLAREFGAEEFYIETKIPALFKRQGFDQSHIAMKKNLK